MSQECNIPQHILCKHTFHSFIHSFKWEMRRHLVRNLIVYAGTACLHQIPSCPRNATYHNTFSVNIHFIHSFIIQGFIIIELNGAFTYSEILKVVYNLLPMDWQHSRHCSFSSAEATVSPEIAVSLETTISQEVTVSAEASVSQEVPVSRSYCVSWLILLYYQSVLRLSVLHYHCFYDYPSSYTTAFGDCLSSTVFDDCVFSITPNCLSFMWNSLHLLLNPSKKITVIAPEINKSCLGLG